MALVGGTCRFVWYENGTVQPYDHATRRPRRQSAKLPATIEHGDDGRPIVSAVIADIRHVGAGWRKKDGTIAPLFLLFSQP